MKIIKVYLIPTIAAILVIIACVNINIVNTKSLSPLGNSNDNFKLVSAEFGEDFQDFIMDKSPVKIYLGEEDDGEATIKVYDKEINLTQDNFFVNTAKKIGGYFNGMFLNIKNKINENTKNNNNTKKQENYKDEFDENVNEFIKNINN